jgi:glycyl-tRNA synthetase beta chain
MLENIKAALSKATSFDQELMCLREIAPPLEQFFDELVVNHEDEAIKQRRLALLGQVTAVFLQVVNFEELED